MSQSRFRVISSMTAERAEAFSPMRARKNCDRRAASVSLVTHAASGKPPGTGVESGREGRVSMKIQEERAQAVPRRPAAGRAEPPPASATA